MQLARGRAPVDRRHDRCEVDAVLIALDDVEKMVDQRRREQGRLQPESLEGRVLGVVVMVLGLDTRVVEVLDRDTAAVGTRPIRVSGGDCLGDLADRHVLGHLVEDPELPPVGGVFGGDPDALDRVDDVD